MERPTVPLRTFLSNVVGNALRALLLKLVIGIFVCVPSAAKAQISPGPLARPHHHLDSATGCTKCHSVSAKTPSFLCTECHQEIAQELQQHRGLHSTFPQSGAPGVGCTKCHSDHNGEDFSLLHWNPAPNGFDHSKTGFILDGKHASVGCRSCHNTGHISASLRSLLGAKDLNRTYMGLPSSCAGCHQDPHQGKFGATCTQCHTTADWKGAKVNPATFDHSKTRFPLTGVHQTTACQKCHIAGPDGQPRYSGLQFSSCSGCHTDPHKGGFARQTCQSCHNTSSWTKTLSDFDHSRTAFPLLGKHQAVTCLTCHKGGDFKTPILHAQCADCHKEDPHSGQFVKRADGGRCESCHTVAGWEQSTFTAADHARTGFPLVTPHGAVTCNACHTPAGRATRFKLPFARCVDCHQDPHAGQFAADPWRNRCEQCHTGSSFTSSIINLARHQQTRFPLTGAHLAIPCGECHKPAAGSTIALFHFARLDCSGCHQDPHKGQFATRMTARNSAGKPLGCELCHSTREWSDIAHFDHSATSFPLQGSHRAVPCIDCHRPRDAEKTALHVAFTSTSTQCGECHQNPHADQFGERGSHCDTCHTAEKWRPSRFDHEKTIFSLKGGHQNVLCTTCHTNTRTVAGRQVLFYKPTPTACSACHEGMK